MAPRLGPQQPCHRIHALGRLEAAQSHAIRALACYEEERSSYPQVFMQIHLAFIAYRANHLEEAMLRGEKAKALIRGPQWNDVNLLAIARVPIATVCYLRGDVDGARRMLERAMPEMAKGEGWVDFFAQGHATLARARFAQEVLGPAREALDDGFAVAAADGAFDRFRGVADTGGRD